jgi:hypothetical protein
VLGVLSLDTLSPLLNVDEMRRQLTRRSGVKSLSQQEIEAKIEKSAQKYRQQLNRDVQEWLRQLSEAWALLMHY